MSFGDRLMHAVNAFTSKKIEDKSPFSFNTSTSYGSARPDRSRLSVSNERSIIASIYTRLGIDIAAVSIRHCKLDDNDRFKENLKTGLNDCLTLEANIDQGARAFRQDAAMTLFDKGVIAIVPVDTTDIPGETSGGFDIQSMRVGEIIEWEPRHVTVRLWNDITGKKEDVKVSKRTTAIIENPLYSVMNESNSTLQRLTRKLNMLDAVDEASSSGKLDLIIQLPYVVKSEAKKAAAEQRRSDVEMQLKGSKYGIAYLDGTEKITQLNRPAENNLLKQIEYLTGMLYTQLGLTETVFNGTADEKVMLNYHNRTIEPILTAMTEAMKRTFLTKTARTQGQSIEYFRDPFKLVAISDIAEIADKFTRNEILSPNEIRGIIGVKPNDEAKSDQLRNTNIPLPEGTPGEAAPAAPSGAPDTSEQDALMEETFSSLEKSIDELVGGSG